ncbi:hypothetical protein ACVWYF_001849 [Hymenobacter sp. UYAg731]
MKNCFSPFAKFIALAACALTLGSCSRSEYAMLPKGSSYHGVTRVATPVPATPETAAVPVAEPAVASVPAAMAESQPATAEVAATPATQTTARVATPAVAVQAPTAVVDAPAPKLNLVQRIAMNKVTRKMDKMIQKSGALRQHDNTASTSKTAAISGNLRTGLIFLLVGLLISLFSGISSIFGVIGAIFAIIGLVFIILWLLDQA